MRYFQDSDGCLANFDQQVFNFFGKWPREIPDDDMWAMILEIADEFWSTMPLKYGAIDLWELLVEKSPLRLVGEGITAKYEKVMPIILTGCPKNHFEVAAAHKIAKAKEHFGDEVQIITCLSRNKPLHMESPGDILIDDFARNTRRWIKAGGRAVHYRTFEQAVTDFKALIEVIENEEVREG